MMRNDGELTEIVINAFHGTKIEMSSERNSVSLLSLRDLQMAL
jgi:hypothetical protein